ncbi:unnamed protein product [[Candida] boidinii]|nr:unnamed protein product [[Candida] boidinii]
MSIVDYVEFFDLIVVGDCQKIPDLVNKYENEILNKPKAKKPTKSQKKPAKSSPKAASTTSAKSTSKSPKSSSKIAKSVKSAKSSTLASSRSPVSSMKKKAELDIKLPAKKRKLIPKK